MRLSSPLRLQEIVLRLSLFVCWQVRVGLYNGFARSCNSEYLTAVGLVKRNLHLTLFQATEKEKFTHIKLKNYIYTVKRETCG